MVAVLSLMLGLCGCLFIDESESGGLDSETGTVKADTWYSTEILAGLNFYNCVISDAFPRSSGGIFATYFPVCRGCHTEGVIGTAILSAEQPYETGYTCSCGTRTSVLIRYNP